MNRLLSANFMRLWKNRCFWGSMLFMLLAGVLIPVRYAFMRKDGVLLPMESNFFSCSLFIAILLSLFCSLFLGTEYSDGTIRNKIIVGHRRSHIYLANLLTNTIAGLLMCAVYFITYLCIGIPLLGFFQAKITMILLFIGIVALLIVAFSALFTMAAMLFSSKAGVVAFCILCAVFLIVAGTYLHAKLSAPKMLPMYSLDVNGVVEEKMERNRAYLEGIKREVYQFLYDFLPGGQVIQCSSMEAKNPYRLLAYSGIIFILTTSAGIFIFSRKDIR